MQKEDIICLWKYHFEIDGVKSSRYCVVYDGFVISSFDEDDEFKARFIASNLFFAFFRVLKSAHDIKVYEKYHLI